MYLTLHKLTFRLVIGYSSRCRLIPAAIFELRNSYSYNSALACNRVYLLPTISTRMPLNRPSGKRYPILKAIVIADSEVLLKVTRS